jgi:hypothetical protein
MTECFVPSAASDDVVLSGLASNFERSVLEVPALSGWGRILITVALGGLAMAVLRRYRLG